METIAEDGGSQGGKEVWCQRENEAEGRRIRQQHKGDIYTQREGRTKSALVKIQGRRWREAIITIHQDNK